MLLRGARSAKRTCVLGLGFVAKRQDSLLHAAKHATGSQQLIDSEPHRRLLGADGFEARYRESDVIRMTSTNQVPQNLGGGEVDLENAGRLQDDCKKLLCPSTVAMVIRGPPDLRLTTSPSLNFSSAILVSSENCTPRRKIL